MASPASLRPGAPSQLAPLLATALAIVLATHFGACGGGSSSPTAPTPALLSAGISASLSPTSPTVRRMANADPSRGLFELRGAVTFRDNGFGGLQLTALEVEVLDVAGHVERQSAPLTLTIPAGGSVTHPLPDSFSLPAGREPLRVRIREVRRRVRRPVAGCRR